MRESTLTKTIKGACMRHQREREKERGSFYILLLKNLWEREKERADPKK